MINNVDNQQAYIDYMMKKLPDVKKGEVYTLQKGDNLWNLAKKSISKDNVTNQEISEYMLQIAKLNNLETVEKMNTLKVSDKIYMPASSSVKSVHKDKIKNDAGLTQTKEYNSAEQSILELKATLLKDKTVFVEQATPSFINLYHVYNDYIHPNSGYHSRKHPLLSFKKGDDGKIKRISFEDKNEDKNSSKYDYDMDSKGNIVIDNYVKQTKVGKISQKDVNELNEILLNLSKNAKISY